MSAVRALTALITIAEECLPLRDANRGSPSLATFGCYLLTMELALHGWDPSGAHGKS